MFVCVVSVNVRVPSCQHLLFVFFLVFYFLSFGLFLDLGFAFLVYLSFLDWFWVWSLSAIFIWVCQSVFIINCFELILLCLCLQLVQPCVSIVPGTHLHTQMKPQQQVTSCKISVRLLASCLRLLKQELVIVTLISSLYSYVVNSVKCSISNQSVKLW